MATPSLPPEAPSPPAPVRKIEALRYVLTSVLFIFTIRNDETYNPR